MVVNYVNLFIDSITNDNRQKGEIKMNFGLDLNNGRTVLIDVSTGEILAEDRDSIRMWLNAYENNFTLTLI